MQVINPNQIKVKMIHSYFNRMKDKIINMWTRSNINIKKNKQNKTISSIINLNWLRINQELRIFKHRKKQNNKIKLKMIKLLRIIIIIIVIVIIIIMMKLWGDKMNKILKIINLKIRI